METGTKSAVRSVNLGQCGCRRESAVGLDFAKPFAVGGGSDVPSTACGVDGDLSNDAPARDASSDAQAVGTAHPPTTFELNKRCCKMRVYVEMDMPNRLTWLLHVTYPGRVSPPPSWASGAGSARAPRLVAGAAGAAPGAGCMVVWATPVAFRQWFASRTQY
jgi:hypothetical protein